MPLPARTCRSCLFEASWEEVTECRLVHNSRCLSTCKTVSIYYSFVFESSCLLGILLTTSDKSSLIPFSILPRALRAVKCRDGRLLFICFFLRLLSFTCHSLPGRSFSLLSIASCTFPEPISRSTMASPRITDCYRVLGIARDATLKDINSAYKKLALKHHPDKVGRDGSSHAEFQKVASSFPHAHTHSLSLHR